MSVRSQRTVDWEPEVQQDQTENNQRSTGNNKREPGRIVIKGPTEGKILKWLFPAI